jgi:hypothetical protein
VALASYFDGSYIGRSWTDGSFVTLAGFAAEDTIWAHFNDRWQAILDDDSKRPKTKYLHMSEAVHLKREFSHRNGWDVQKVFALVTDLLMYMQTLDKQRLRQFACTVDLKVHRKLLAEGRKLNDPIEICNEYCPYSVLAWYVTKYPGVIHSAHYFFDKDEPFQEAFREKWSEEKERRISPGGADMFWSLIKSVASAAMRSTPALQAADLLAWATNRILSKAPDEPALGKHLEHIMKQIIPSSWILWDEKKFMETGPLD